jgi:two-component system NtrC family sensor kinase
MSAAEAPGSAFGIPPMDAALFRSVLDRALARVAFIDRDLRHLYANPEYAAFVGLTPEAILGRSVADLLGAEAAALLAPLSARALAGETVRWLGWMTYADGRRRYVERVYRPVPDAEGQVQGYFAIVRDLTELKEREEDLARRTAQLEAILGHIAEGVNIVDAAGNVVLVNEGFLRMYGYPAALGEPGTPLERFVRWRLEHGAFYAHENPEEPLDLLVRRRVASIMAAESGTIEEARPDGRVFEVRRRRLPDGGLLSTYTDITTVKRAEREVRSQRDAVRQAERLSALGSLLAGVAHELNNPLSIVIAHATLLAEQAGDAPGLGARATKIKTAAERCGRIVQTFLGMARRRPPERRLVAIGAVIDAALDLIGYALRSAGIAVMRDVAADTPEIAADQDQLVQVLINLLTNAQQALAGREGQRRITITARAGEEGGLVLAVADNGPGVPPALRQRVFDPFFTTRQEGGGTGVGLSLCRAIVSAHAGSVGIDETPGGGATVRLVLPRGRLDPAPGEPPAAEERPGLVVRQVRTALIVDDEEEVAAVLAEILRDDGFLVETAADGQLARERLAARSFDVVLSDLRMPGLDGAALHAWLREARPELAARVAFVTGDRLGAAAEASLAATGQPVLAKPFSPAEVRRVVRGLAGA